MIFGRSNVSEPHRLSLYVVVFLTEASQHSILVALLGSKITLTVAWVFSVALIKTKT